MSAISDEEVGGLDVTMHDAFGVGGVESVGNLDSQEQHGFDFERPATDLVFERFALEELHDDEGLAVVIANFVDGADVGMIQRRSGLRFPLETGERLRVLSELIWEKL